MNSLSVSLGREELVRRVILQDRVDITSIVITSNDDQTSILEGLGGRVPSVPGHLEVTSDIRARIRSSESLGSLEVFTRVVGTGVEQTDSGTSVRVVISTSVCRCDSVCNKTVTGHHITSAHLINPHTQYDSSLTHPS